MLILTQALGYAQFKYISFYLNSVRLGRLEVIHSKSKRQKWVE